MNIKKIRQIVIGKNECTKIEKIDENTLSIDGEQHHFPPQFDVYDVNDGTYRILNASRQDGELYVEILFQFDEKDVEKYRGNEEYEAI